jgi:hypothetical protein
MTVRHGLRQGQVAVVVCLVALLGLHAQAGNEAVESRMKRDVTFLASDVCEGRGVGTKGIDLAADYIAAEFKKAGLKPGGDPGSFFQPFPVYDRPTLGPANRLTVRGARGEVVELRSGTDYQVLGFSGNGQAAVPVTFVGYGLTAKKLGYDDYQGVDVAGKAVLVLRRTPRAENPNYQFDGDASAYHAALSTKIENAERHKAAAILFVSDRAYAGDSDPLLKFSETSAFGAGASVPVLQVKRAVADTLLQASLGRSLAEVEQDLDRELKPHSADLTGWTVAVDTTVNRPTAVAKNIIGILEGSGPLANETVIIGAHYDHLGYGARYSRGTATEQGHAIHHGADDNASGSATVLELARRFGQQHNRVGRRLVFMTFSGEESGLLGSAYYCKHPLLPLEDTVAMVNMDMVGRLRSDPETHKERLIVYGTGSAKTFDKLIETVNARPDFQLKKVPNPYGPSDQESFYDQRIPVYFFFTDYHEDYHRPSDTADKINVPGMARIADLVQELVERLETVPERPQYLVVPRPPPPHGGGPRLGIRPDYGDAKEGVLLAGVSADGPAAKAGLKEGDRIIEMADKPIKNLESYMAVMAGQHKGSVLSVSVLRNGKKVILKIVLE